MKLSLDLEDVTNLISTEDRDNILFTTSNGKLYVPGLHVENIVRRVVKVELEKLLNERVLMDEEKR